MVRAIYIERKKQHTPHSTHFLISLYIFSFLNIDEDHHIFVPLILDIATFTIENAQVLPANGPDQSRGCPTFKYCIDLFIISYPHTNIDLSIFRYLYEKDIHSI